MNNIKGINRENLDPAVKPGDDFYQYATGGWQKKHPLEGEYSRFGTFDLMRENNRLQIKELIMNLDKNPDSKKKGTVAQKITDIYKMGMDDLKLNREGIKPLMPIIEKIKNSRRENLAETLAWLHLGPARNTFISYGVGSDYKDSSKNILHLGSTGLLLGDREYYTEKSERNDTVLQAYEIYVKRLMELAGYNSEAQQRVLDNVKSLEMEFAKHTMPRELYRDPTASYNITTIEEIEKNCPNFQWRRYLEGIGIEIPEKININYPPFMEALNRMLPEITDQQIEDYLVLSAITDATGLMSDDFVDADFELFGRVMSGREEKKPRWKRIMGLATSMFGEAVGELYVERYFPESSKDYMKGLVENLRKSLVEHIDALEWMSGETKCKARDKVNSMTVKIGYPDKWKDYSEIDIDSAKPLLDNVLEASRWFIKDRLSKIGKDVDREEWFMTPQTVNAYYSPLLNEICFPAGILQAPYFCPDADDAVNYGAIGVIIGHEMTHSLDDSGRRFDKEGNLTDWWNAEDEKRFKEITGRLEEQFNQVEVAPGVKANGKYTLGENIADQGGIGIALTAYSNGVGKSMEESAVKEDAENNSNIPDDGFTPLQRFFLSYAGLWAGNIRPEEILVLNQTDPHSLGRNRVNVTLKNIAPFFLAFGIKDGDPMYLRPEERVTVW